MSKPLKVLLVDDTEPNLLLASKFINKLGHETVLARNGREAVEKFQAETIDLILMDIMMPEMDGYEATRRIREISSRWVPILFLTEKGQDEDHVRGIQAGGDDYITKPFNFPILEARIKAFSRIADMQHQILENSLQLQHYRDENLREQQLAKHLIKKITRSEHMAHEHIRTWNVPAQHFSGDIFIAAPTPAEHIHLLLADGTGHGLSAALNVMPVVEVFYGMSAKGFSISAIAQELNHKIKQLLPTDRFVAATLVSLDFKEKILHIWNGGNPPALFLDEKGETLRSWKSTHPALGIFHDHEFDSTSEVFHWSDPGQLILCSDGLIEAQNPAGEEFGLSRLEHTLSSTSFDQRHDALIAAVLQHMAALVSHDDVSLATIDCPANVADNAQFQKADIKPDLPEHLDCACRWKVGLHLTAAELKEIDVVPMLLTWMDQLQLNKRHRGQIFLIFTELFNNALDHGILNLDSELKSLPEGFEQYIEQRRQRLTNLLHGIVEIEFERLRYQNSEILTIRIRDTGKGFDYNKYMSGKIDAGTRLSGRGLALVKSLCSKMEFASNGSEISVHYTLA
ncbi:MAG: SpoIIE family protein phosphatase [Gammaproteobacteria bacterium]|nr:SpoIIE family protein phosphatase [Gammaproteobacteria bacterium]MBU1731178.1 SpoIIE family protein phosphatase [Gammaproteobacteria bacterium]MBU1891489.1 SpoIIE family protein phosphatase [Gammaproteobacteria bacterium]